MTLNSPPLMNIFSSRKSYILNCMILGIRTDKPEAELYVYDNDKVQASLQWYAHRELSDTLLQKIEEVLSRASATKQTISGIAIFQGPGSFTGLRIGISVANSLAYSLNVPVAATQGDDWLERAITQLIPAAYSGSAIPHYGSEVHITKQKK